MVSSTVLEDEDKSEDGDGDGAATSKGGKVKEEPDFIETHCNWTNCDRDFGTQEDLVKVF